MSAAIKAEGMRYGKLTLVRNLQRGEHGGFWEAVCDCGERKAIRWLWVQKKWPILCSCDYPPERVHEGVLMKRLPDFPEYYAGEDGRIYSFKSGKKSFGRKLRSAPGGMKMGYLIIMLCKNKKIYGARVHRQVCMAWHGRPPKRGEKGIHASHLDGDATNNRPDNLAWETPKENAARKPVCRGFDHHNSRFDRHSIKVIRKLISLGVSSLAISRIMGCSGGTILNIKKGRNYGDANPNHASLVV
jgi:HNH endonuclease